MVDDWMPVPLDERRVTNGDRDRTIEVLRAAVVDGSLDLEELAERIEGVYRARTAGELDVITHDLPAAQRAEVPKRRSIWRNPGLRLHLVSWGLVNSFLVGIWGITGAEHFWPFYPAAGWGIGLALHAFTVSAHKPHGDDRRRATRDPYQRGGRGGALVSGVPSARSRRPAQKGRPPPELGASAPSRPGAPNAPVERVAVLFTDIAGSTQLTGALGDVGWAQLRERFRALVAACVSDHRGTEVSVQGDGILARFTTEVDAVRGAVAIQRTLEQQRSDTGFAPSVRIGVHAGEVVAEGADLVGQVINLAARVTAEAEPGEVLVTEAVAERLGDRFPVQGRGLRHLKGVAQPRHLLAVDWS